MLYREIFRIIGYFLFLFSSALLLPLLVSAYYQFFTSPEVHPQPHTTIDFFITLIICLGLAMLLHWLGRKASGTLYFREGICAVVCIWIITPAISAIPFLTSGTLKDPNQAFFEMVSGYTSTGSTVLHAKKYNAEGVEVPIEATVPGVINTTYVFYGNVKPVKDDTGAVIKTGIEAVSKGLLFWRSFTQWLGGVGIIVLFVAVFPALGIGGKVLYQAEIAGPVKEGTRPRIKETAINIWIIYFLLTLAQVIILLIVNSNLSLFESLTISFSTISTGGFSTLNDSIAGFHSPAIEWVIIVFMMLGSINFSLYYYLVKGKFYRLVDPELILFLIITTILSGLLIYTITGTPETPLFGHVDKVFKGEEDLRTSLFTMISSLTTTGFFISNYDVWPYAAQALLIVAMFFGGMSGSTAGGFKTIRIYMLFRVAQNRVESLFRPDHLRILKIGIHEIDYNLANTVLVFFLLAISLSGLGTLLYIFDGIDPETAIGLTACLINNVGMSFRVAGPEWSCAFMSDFSLLLSSLLMIFGRLEFFAVFAILVPAFWRQDS